MFEVNRPDNAPAGLSTTKGYQAPDVVESLHDIFHGKCYLCESHRLEAPEIEHFEPQAQDESKKNEWSNLFYACRRCNSIKTAKAKELLDCTKVDAFKAIIVELPNRPSRPIIVEGTTETSAPPKVINNTVELLHECYNNATTAYRGITQTELRRKMYEHLEFYYEYTAILRNYRAGKTKKNEAAEGLEVMLQPTYPYHAVWRRMFIEDTFLTKNYSRLLEDDLSLVQAG